MSWRCWSLKHDYISSRRNNFYRNQGTFWIFTDGSVRFICPPEYSMIRSFIRSHSLVSRSFPHCSNQIFLTVRVRHKGLSSLVVTWKRIVSFSFFPSSLLCHHMSKYASTIYEYLWYSCKFEKIFLNLFVKYNTFVICNISLFLAIAINCVYEFYKNSYLMIPIFFYYHENWYFESVVL